MTPEGANMLRKRKVVLIANDRTAAMKLAVGRTVWAPRLTHMVMEVSLRLLCPSAKPQDINRAITVSNGDLRQAQLHLNLSGGSVDKSSHVYFDVKDVLCHGSKMDLEYHERNWVSENHCQVNQSCSDHADMSDWLVIADTLRDTNVAGCIAGLAASKLTYQSRKADFDLRPPRATTRSTHLKLAMQSLQQTKRDQQPTQSSPEGNSRKRTRECETQAEVVHLGSSSNDLSGSSGQPATVAGEVLFKLLKVYHQHSASVSFFQRCVHAAGMRASHRPHKEPIRGDCGNACRRQRGDSVQRVNTTGAPRHFGGTV